MKIANLLHKLKTQRKVTVYLLEDLLFSLIWVPVEYLIHLLSLLSHNLKSLGTPDVNR